MTSILRKLARFAVGLRAEDLPENVRREAALKIMDTVAAGIGAVFAVLFQFISGPFFSLFTSDAVVRDFAVQYMRTYVIDCIFAGIHFQFSGFFSAAGVSIYSFIHNLISVLCVRIPGAWLATKMFPDTLYAMGLAAPAGSVLSVIICVLFYRHLRKTGRV